MPLSYSFGGASLHAFTTLKTEVEEILIRQNTPKAVANSAVLGVVAIGKAPLSYQWYFNNAPIEGATSSTYSNTSVPGVYKCVVSNAYGEVTSQETTVVPLPPYSGLVPTILTQPADAYIDFNEFANFSLAVVGAIALNYQWYENGLPVASGGPSISIRNDNVPLYLRDGYTYQCKVFNTFGEVFSDTVKIKFKPKKPLVNLAAESYKTVVEGNPLTLNVGNVVAYPDYTVDWYLPSGQNSQTGSPLTIPSVTVEPGFFNYGINDIHWKVYNIAGFERGVVFVNVIPASQAATFYIANGPEQVTLTTPTLASFSVDVFPAGLPYEYRWLVDGVPVQGFSTGNANFNYSWSCTETITTRTVSVEVKYGERRVISPETSLILSVTPIINNQPTNRGGNVGDMVVFTVDVCSPNLYVYQWYRNGLKITGATNKDLGFYISSANVHLSEFYCEVSLPGSVQKVTSDIAILTVLNYA